MIADSVCVNIFWYCENYRPSRSRRRPPRRPAHAAGAGRPAPALCGQRDARSGADPRGEFLSAVYAAPAYRLFGLEAWRDRAAAARHPIAAASATTCARGRMTSPPTIGNSSSTSSTGRSPRSDSAPVPFARCRRAGRRKHPASTRGIWASQFCSRGRRSGPASTRPATTKPKQASGYRTHGE